MNLVLRNVTDRDEALALAGELQKAAADGLSEMRTEPLPEAAVERFLESRWGAPETLLLAAEEKGGARRWGLCLVGPHEDPLTLERTPVILALAVDPNLRHRGVARALVAEARRTLAQRGLRALAARAAHNDDALISMGERWGFIREWEWMVHG